MLQVYTREEKSVIQLVLPSSWVGRLNSLAIERNTSRSALIREAVSMAYFGTQDEQGLGDYEQGGEDE